MKCGLTVELEVDLHAVLKELIPQFDGSVSYITPLLISLSLSLLTAQASSSTSRCRCSGKCAQLSGTCTSAAATTLSSRSASVTSRTRCVCVCVCVCVCDYASATRRKAGGRSRMTMGPYLPPVVGGREYNRGSDDMMTTRKADDDKIQAMYHCKGGIMMD